LSDSLSRLSNAEQYRALKDMIDSDGWRVLKLYFSERYVPTAFQAVTDATNPHDMARAVGALAATKNLVPTVENTVEILKNLK
jgi:hypothetical protein